MKASLQRFVYHIRGSYWFFPSLMALAATILSAVTIHLDHTFDTVEFAKQYGFTLNQPTGARALLATVAGSMITVAGVTFSLTILAVSFASSNFGPRLLSNFMRDRGNQFTLGVFISTFLYCLLILRVVRGTGDGAIDDLELDSFVPQLSLIVALAMTIASVGVLIYYIHHVPESIHITNLLYKLAIEMDQKIDQLYPEKVGQEAPDKDIDSMFLQGPHLIRCSKSGYLQGLDSDEIVEVAKKYDAVLRLLKRPGDFLIEGEVIIEVVTDQPWNHSHSETVLDTMAIGHDQTPTQDVFFIVNQFVEVAIRALSPGVNDPFTAMQCLDWLSSGLVRVSQRKLPGRYRTDKQGQLRVVTTELTYSDFVAVMLGQLIDDVKTNSNVRGYFTESAMRICATSDNLEFNQLVQNQIKRLNETAADNE